MYKLDFSHPVSVYFVGIGGVSMCGLAELLADAGFHVSGSDRSRSALTSVLESKGITVFYGQRAENITDSIDCVIFTSAIHPDNPEYIAAHERQLPCLTRGQLMGQIMKNYHTPIAVSGTHGKTTTTSMVSEILLAADTDPTLSIGGILKDIGGNMRIGKSGYFVTEACEYTNSFLDFSPKIGIILNIEEDHLDFFKDLADIRSSFRKFAQLLPADGCLIINGAIENLQEITDGLACRVVTFGTDAASDYYPAGIHYDENGHPEFILHDPEGRERNFVLQVPGEHNISNALAAIALADLLSIDSAVIAKALRDYSGTDRRFEYKGTIGGVTVIDDYAHHPTEITATLRAAANHAHNRLWCVFQPHTYSRTKAFLKEFARALTLADKVVLADIYAARETDTLGISSETLQREIQALGKDCYYFPTFDEIENFLLENCINGDMLITMGAGDVVKIGENLLGK
ncbi:MAG: UDP-N-acetylmuramate--L-alanine ligase [Lachnospiraceae bacterium]|nr:UDP-N-acetylmuramate--L-alanine ligase [Lachnospiraceae bacterium]